MPRSFLVKKYFAKQKPNYSELECQNGELWNFLYCVWIVKAFPTQVRKLDRQPPAFTSAVCYKCKSIFVFVLLVSGSTTNPVTPRSSRGPLDALSPLSATRQSSIHVTSPCEYVGGNGPWNLPMVPALCSVNADRKTRIYNQNKYTHNRGSWWKHTYQINQSLSVCFLFFRYFDNFYYYILCVLWYCIWTNPLFCLRHFTGEVSSCWALIRGQHLHCHLLHNRPGVGPKCPPCPLPAHLPYRALCHPRTPGPQLPVQPQQQCQQ